MDDQSRVWWVSFFLIISFFFDLFFDFFVHYCATAQMRLYIGVVRVSCGGIMAMMG